MASPPGFRGRRRRTFGGAFAFRDFDVLIDGRIDELVHLAAGPFDLDAINLRGLANTKNLTRIMRREKTAAAGFQSRALHAAGRPRDDRADRARIARSEERRAGK